MSESLPILHEQTKFAITDKQQKVLDVASELVTRLEQEIAKDGKGRHPSSLPMDLSELRECVLEMWNEVDGDTPKQF